MAKSIRYVGLDVHADTIAVAMAEGRGEVRSMGTIPNRPGPIRKLVKRLEPLSTLRVCYEAGPTGYALYWQLTELGVKCEVVAPTLVPEKAGDRVKTDRRDAKKLVRLFRAGELVFVAPPDEQTEGLRDLMRCREDLRCARTAARHRVAKQLLRHGRIYRDGKQQWTKMHIAWVRRQRLEDPLAQQALEQMLCHLDGLDRQLARLDRDTEFVVLCRPADATTLASLGPNWQMLWLQGADHSFHVLKSSGRTDADVLAEVGEVSAAWIARLSS